ncbi:MAG: hypothetical protein LAO04_04655 [Acidobacteriia bacterium]|nr:hypothetical protein [Terriglobia bacterium]
MERDYCDASKHTSAGVVELRTTWRMFYTSTSGSPDMLFIVLTPSYGRQLELLPGSPAHHPSGE